MCFEVANCFQALDLREGEGLPGELNTGRGGGGCAEMGLRSQRFSMCRARRPRAIHYAAEAEMEEPFCGTSALIWRQTSEKKGGGKRGWVVGGVRIWMH